MVATDPNAPQKSDFLAAEDIKGILRGRDRAEQERIIRWVSESLELTSIPRSAGPTHHQVVSPADPLAQPIERTRAKDIRTFVAEKQPRSDIHFVAVVAYYQRFLAPEPDRKDSIKSDDLQTAARLSNRAVFKKPTTTLNNAVRLGYLDRGARGEYRLNAVGENLVAMTLPGSGDTNGSKPAKRRRRMTSASKRTKNKKSRRT